MKWAGRCLRIHVRCSRDYWTWTWGCYLTPTVFYAPGLRLLICLGRIVLTVYLTWPERSRP